MSEQLVSNTQPIEDASPNDEIHLLDLLIILVEHKKLVIGTPIAAGMLALIASLLMTPIFTSTAKIMPPQQQSSGLAAALGKLGDLAGVAGSVGGIKNPGDLYVSLLESRTLRDRLIADFKLQERYENKTQEEARDTLAQMTKITSGKKDGIIAVSVREKDPKFAAQLANGYFVELTKLTRTMALTEASQHRVFFEEQMKEAKNQLAAAEIALRRTQEKTGMIQPDGQVQAIISTVAQLKGAIAAKEVQVNAMRTFATGQNPELVRTQEELRSLRSQLTKLEKNRLSGEADFLVPTGKIPEVGVEYVRSMRDVKYYETIFEMMAKQFELAKVEEARDSSQIRLLDAAIPAERKTEPRRAMITLAGAAGGGMLGIVLAFMSAAYRTARRNPANDSRWQQLSMAWNNRSGHVERRHTGRPWSAKK